MTDKAKKKRIKKYLTWVGIALTVLILTVMPLLARTDTVEDGPQASVLSGTVQTGDLETGIRGGGTLAEKDAEDVTLPTGVKITEFLVNNGDIVEKGTPLATVDKVSVMTAVTQVQETLDYLRGEIADAKSEKVSAYISATAGGRVKAVYAQAGDSVEAVMMEHGALAVLSLDGKMAVTLQRDTQLRTGDSVTVRLGDGTEITGRVESNLDGELTVTVEDEGYAIGESVIVTDDDGNRIGSGELYVHNAWKAMGYAGTVSTVYAVQERTVGEGATLFTLTDREFTAQLQSLSDLHREYEELMQDLLTMYTTGTIDAPCDGIVSGVDRDSAHLLAAQEDAWQADTLSASGEKTWKVMLLGTGTEEKQCTKDSDCLLAHDSLAHEEGCIMACDRATTADGCDATRHHGDCIGACTHADTADDCTATGTHHSDCIRSCASAAAEGKCKATKHYCGCIESCISSDGTIACPATGTHHSHCIKSCTKEANCPGTQNHYNTCKTHCTGNSSCDALCHKETCPLAGTQYYLAQAAIVTASGQQIVAKADTATVYTVTVDGDGWKLDKDLNTELMITETIIPSSYKCSPGDIILYMTGYDSNDNATGTRVIVYRKAQQQTPDMGSLEDMMAGMMNGMGNLSGMMGGLSGYGSLGGTTGSEQSLFDLTGSTLMTVTPSQSISLTISVDEQEIGSLSLGQSAQVRVTALGSEVFEAEITALGTAGTNSGGSSKFAVELTLPRSADMLAGMSATASIPLATRMDAATIPVAALVEESGRTVVYTALDSETGQPTDPVEVTLGISDGETVQVLTGLEPGDTFYYSYYDTLELSTDVERDQNPFG